MEVFFLIKQHKWYTKLIKDTNWYKSEIISLEMMTKIIIKTDNYWELISAQLSAQCYMHYILHNLISILDYNMILEILNNFFEDHIL